MKKIHFSLLILLLLMLPWSSSSQLSIEISRIPSNTPLSDPIYIAGNFNNWNEQDDNYRLTNHYDGTYTITLNPTPGQLKFKFTRGNWASVEGNGSGGFRPDRIYDYSGGTATLQLDILSWEDLGAPGNRPTTATDNVFLLDADFFIPQLNRNRRIWIYLPPDYQTSGKRYPVIYMQDGQNLFDAYNSFSGEWEIDETLNRLFSEGDRGVIIVGIDNGGASRLDEYSPWAHPVYGGGQGDEYTAFIVNTLKPYIDTHYRTHPSREHTGIMGSSMGGLIAMYSAIEHQDVFGKAGIFSPAFWFSPEVYNHVSNTGKQEDMRIYLLAGEREDNGSVVMAIQNMYNTLRSAGFSDTEVIIDTDADGQHSEWYWRREFAGAYRWLCAALSTSTPTPLSAIDIQFFPNPTGEVLHIILKEPLIEGRYQFHNASGQLLLSRPFKDRQNYIQTADLPSGIYFLTVYEGEKQLGTQQVVLRH